MIRRWNKGVVVSKPPLTYYSTCFIAKIPYHTFMRSPSNRYVIMNGSTHFNIIETMLSLNWHYGCHTFSCDITSKTQFQRKLANYHVEWKFSCFWIINQARFSSVLFNFRCMSRFWTKSINKLHLLSEPRVPRPLSHT